MVGAIPGILFSPSNKHIFMYKIAVSTLQNMHACMCSAEIYVAIHVHMHIAIYECIGQ